MATSMELRDFLLSYSNWLISTVLYQPPYWWLVNLYGGLVSKLLCKSSRGHCSLFKVVARVLVRPKARVHRHGWWEPRCYIRYISHARVSKTTSGGRTMKSIRMSILQQCWLGEMRWWFLPRAGIGTGRIAGEDRIDWRHLIHCAGTTGTGPCNCSTFVTEIGKHVYSMWQPW